MLARRLSALFALGLSVAASACTKDASDRGADSAGSADARDSAAASGAGAAAGDSARRVASIAGFNTPESVKYDAALDVYFVSNINGNPSGKDGNGWIARVKPDSTGGSATVDTLVRGGRSGVTLNAPKGMAIVGDTLWVADIDAVRGFNKITGAPVRTVNLASMQATFLNDIAVDNAGNVYVTDTGIRFKPDGTMGTPGKQRIFRFTGTQRATEAITGDSLGNPNGIAWDASRNGFVVAPFGANSVMSWANGDSAMKPVASGPGQYDGIEVVSGGRILVSSWADSSVNSISGGTLTKIISGVEAPADIGYDSKRDRVLIPLFNGNRVEIWTTGRR